MLHSPGYVYLLPAQAVLPVINDNNYIETNSVSYFECYQLPTGETVRQNVADSFEELAKRNGIRVSSPSTVNNEKSDERLERSVNVEAVKHNAYDSFEELARRNGIRISSPLTVAEKHEHVQRNLHEEAVKHSSVNSFEELARRNGIRVSTPSAVKNERRERTMTDIHVPSSCRVLPLNPNAVEFSRPTILREVSNNPSGRTLREKVCAFKTSDTLETGEECVGRDGKLENVEVKNPRQLTSDVDVTILTKNLEAMERKISLLSQETEDLKKKLKLSDENNSRKNYIDECIETDNNNNWCEVSSKATPNKTVAEAIPRDTCVEFLSDTNNEMNDNVTPPMCPTTNDKEFGVTKEFSVIVETKVPFHSAHVTSLCSQEDEMKTYCDASLGLSSVNDIPDEDNVDTTKTDEKANGDVMVLSSSNGPDKLLGECGGTKQMPATTMDGVHSSPLLNSTSVVNSAIIDTEFGGTKQMSAVTTMDGAYSSPLLNSSSMVNSAVLDTEFDGTKQMSATTMDGVDSSPLLNSSYVVNSAILDTGFGGAKQMSAVTTMDGLHSSPLLNSTSVVKSAILDTGFGGAKQMSAATTMDGVHSLPLLNSTSVVKSAILDTGFGGTKQMSAATTMDGLHSSPLLNSSSVVNSAILDTGFGGTKQRSAATTMEGVDLLPLLNSSSVVNSPIFDPAVLRVVSNKNDCIIESSLDELNLLAKQLGFGENWHQSISRTCSALSVMPATSQTSLTTAAMKQGRLFAVSPMPLLAPHPAYAEPATVICVASTTTNSSFQRLITRLTKQFPSKSRGELVECLRKAKCTFGDQGFRKRNISEIITRVGEVIEMVQFDDSYGNLFSEVVNE